jgi:hypothetical protein
VPTTDGETPGQAHDALIGSIEEAPMNHHETIALAEQHRIQLLADAAGTRRRRSERRSRKIRWRA